MKIYIVTWGDYADYSIMGIYDSFELAITLIKDRRKCIDFDTMCIEEHLVNKQSDNKNITFDIDKLKRGGHI